MDDYNKMLQESPIQIPLGNVLLDGILLNNKNSRALIIFAHGSGSSRNSPRNLYVAHTLVRANYAALLFDLLSEEEEAEDYFSGKKRFDINMLSERLVEVSQWVISNKETDKYKIGFFGASTGAAAAIVAAVKLKDKISAVVSRGGRPDLAMNYLPLITAPVLLIVGGNDNAVIDLNEMAFKYIKTDKDIIIVPGATHLFEEEGKLQKVAQHAIEWFNRYLVT